MRLIDLLLQVDYVFGQHGGILKIGFAYIIILLSYILYGRKIRWDLNLMKLLPNCI